MRVHSCKRAALVTTTFSNSRGGRLRELSSLFRKTIEATKIYEGSRIEKPLPDRYPFVFIVNIKSIIFSSS